MNQEIENKLNELRKNLETPKETFNLEEKNQLDIPNDIVGVGSSTVYEELSVDELKVSNVWPLSTLPIRNLVPYLKRMKTKKGSLVGLIVDDVSGANIRYFLDSIEGTSVKVLGETSALFELNIKGYEDRVVKYTNEEDLDFVFIANPTVDLDVYNKFYTKVSNSGIFAGTNYNDDNNIPLIRQFRKDHKISVNVEVLESGCFFWVKEDYSNRGKPTDPNSESIIPNNQSIPESRVPTADDSHLKIEYVEQYGAGKIFVETGTYLGQTVELMQRMSNWNEINSIEIDEELFNAAKEKFKDDDRVKIWLGDSSIVLRRIVDHLEEPATFWLDAHPSGPLRGNGKSPVIEELEIILSGKRKDHTIFIDDARLFGSGEWGGVQLADAMRVIEKINPTYTVKLLDGQRPQDVLCFTVKE